MHLQFIAVSIAAVAIAVIVASAAYVPTRSVFIHSFIERTFVLLIRSKQFDNVFLCDSKKKISMSTLAFQKTNEP